MKEPLRILDYIPAGKENAIPVRDLASILGISDRELRKAVEAERCSGSVILCANDGAGYYISEDPHEIRKFTNRMRSHAFSMLRAAKSAYTKAEQLEKAAALPPLFQDGAAGQELPEHIKKAVP